MTIELILVGTDHSVNGSLAVDWAVDLAQQCGAETTVIEARTPRQSERAPSGSVRESEKSRNALAPQLTPAERSDRSVELRVIDGGPGDVIVDEAARRNADLVVVGRHGGSNPFDTDLDAVSTHVLRHIDRPIAILPNAARAVTGPVVVGVDGSRSNVSALKWAIDLAGHLNTSLFGLFAVDPMADTFPHSTGWTYRGEHHVREEFRRYNTEVASSLEVVSDDPADALSLLADDVGAAAIVVGRHGHPLLLSHSVGRVPRRLVRRAHTAVVVVPPSVVPADTKHGFLL
jgi:nucleotide-binding universal stress UspA family protein